MKTSEAELTSLEHSWLTQQQRISKLSRKLHACHLEFMRTELEVGLTFASFALAARHDKQKRARCERIAQQAYDAAGRFAAPINWSARERKELARKIQRLKRNLGKLAARKA